MESEELRHSSASCESESDGYHSEVFEDGGTRDVGLPDVISSLINGPFDNVSYSVSER